MKIRSLLLTIVLIAAGTASCEQPQTIPTDLLDGTITALTVEAEAANITVMSAADESSHVEVTADEQGATPDFSMVRRGANLYVSCLSRCGGNIAIAVPKAFDINVSVTDGNIELTEIRGDIHAVTKLGDIFIERVGGVTQLESGGGDIIGREVESQYIAAETGIGNIDLAFNVPPVAADLEAGTGNAAVTVPKGAFDITTESPTTASVSEGIVNIPASSRAIHAAAPNGTVFVLSTSGMPETDNTGEFERLSDLR